MHLLLENLLDIYNIHTDIDFHFLVRDNNSIVEIDHCDYCCCIVVATVAIL